MKNYRDLEISELEIFCLTKIFEFSRKFHEKFEILLQRRNEIFFLPRIKLFRLSKEIFTFLYHIVDLPTSKFCRYLENTKGREIMEVVQSNRKKFVLQVFLCKLPSGCIQFRSRWMSNSDTPGANAPKHFYHISGQRELMYRKMILPRIERL